jgi:Flp pilus assembly protein TadG
LKLNRKRSPAGRSRSVGQSLVEFALVFPLFILLLAGMIDFGMGLYSYMTIINAARDGARLGATACGALACSDPVTARVTAAAGGLEPDVAVVCVSASSSSEVACVPKTPTEDGVVKGDSVTVTASYTYRMLWPLTFGTEIPMSSSVKFMVE